MPKIETAWVIEHQDSSTALPVYYTGYRSNKGWSTPGDHESALRFARARDALRLAELLTDETPGVQHRVAEHEWDCGD